MKTYYFDTNVFLRFILKDNLILWKQSNNFFEQAKNKVITLVLIPEIVFEIEYVLRKLYQLNKNQIYKYLFYLINTTYIKVIEKNALYETLSIYLQVNIDLVDIYLFAQAENNNAQVVSFDTDFKKLEKFKK